MQLNISLSPQPTGSLLLAQDLSIHRTSNRASFQKLCGRISNMMLMIWALTPICSSTLLHHIYQLFHFLIMIIFIAVLTYNSYYIHLLSFAVVSDLYAGICYFLLWIWCYRLLTFKSIRTHVKYKHGPSIKVAVIAICIFLYTLSLDLYYLTSDVALDFAQYNKTAKTSTVPTWSEVTYHICNLIVGSLARPTSLMLASCCCKFMEQQFVFLKQRAMKNDSVQNISFDFQRYFMYMGSINTAVTGLVSILHVEVLFELLIRGIFILQGWNEETFLEKWLQSFNAFMLLLGLILLDLDLSKIFSTKKECIKTFLTTKQDMHNIQLIEYVPVPSILGMKMTRKKIIGLIYSATTLIYVASHFQTLAQLTHN